MLRAPRIRALAARGLLATTIAASVLSVVPAPAFALEPPRPLPGYRAAFVTEVDGGAVQDCLWASVSMLLDKWTNGDVSESRQRLRRLSGDRGGSNFGDVKIAFDRLGMPFRYSPDGGDRMTWSMLLGRLSHGAGAVVLGDYGSLPRRYGRWDLAFWKKDGEDDNHAMYLDRYDPRSGRVFLMDPLAPAGWPGEWIPARTLRKFVWQTGGAVFAATTPTARRAPFAGVRLGKPAAAADVRAIQFDWAVTKAPKGWRFPGVAIHWSAEPVSGAELASGEPDLIALPADGATAVTAARATATRRRLHLALPTPTKPGAYRVAATLTERRFGRTVARTGTRIVYVPGERWADLAAPSQLAAEAGDSLSFDVVVRNRGSVPWVVTVPGAGPAVGSIEDPHARLVGTWVPVDVPPARSSEAEAALGPDPAPVTFGAVPLRSGDGMIVPAQLELPHRPGRWTLLVDVVDDIVGSYAAIGSAPALITVDIAAPVLDPIRR
jgi:hypothetical protein